MTTDTTGQDQQVLAELVSIHLAQLETGVVAGTPPVQEAPQRQLAADSELDEESFAQQVERLIQSVEQLVPARASASNARPQAALISILPEILSVAAGLMGAALIIWLWL